MTIAAPRVPFLRGVHLGMSRVLAQLALASVVLLMLGIVAGTVLEQPVSKASWIFDVVPHVLLATILTVGTAFLVGLPLRVTPLGRAWLRAHGWLVWMAGAAGVVFTIGALALTGVDPLLFSSGRPGYFIPIVLLAIAWCVTGFCAVHLPVWFADTDRDRRRATTLTRELGILALQVVVACAVVLLVVAVMFVVTLPLEFSGVQGALASFVAASFSVVIFVSAGFVLGLPIRVIGIFREFWGRYGELSLIGVLASLAGVVFGAMSPGSPALDFWLLTLAFFLVNARLPIRRWRDSLARRHPSAP